MIRFVLLWLQALLASEDGYIGEKTSGMCFTFGHLCEQLPPAFIYQLTTHGWCLCDYSSYSDVLH